MVALTDDILIQGVYSIEQASRLARIKPQTLSRWMDGNATGSAALQRQMPESTSRAIGFVDLIQAMAIRALRNREHKISLQKIRETIDAAEKMGIRYPFARRHQTFLFVDDVVIKTEGGDLIQVTGKYKTNHLIKPVVELYLQDLYFDNDGLAHRYSPKTMRDGDCQVIIDPGVKFGSPYVDPSGYTVAALLDAVNGEGSASAAAEAYDVDESVINLALRYDDWLSGTTA